MAQGEKLRLSDDTMPEMNVRLWDIECSLVSASITSPVPFFGTRKRLSFSLKEFREDHKTESKRMKFSLRGRSERETGGSSSSLEVHGKDSGKKKKQLSGSSSSLEVHGKDSGKKKKQLSGSSSSLEVHGKDSRKKKKQLNSDPERGLPSSASGGSSSSLEVHGKDSRKKKKQLILPGPSVPGLRRSQRTRLPPLDYFRNERALYRRRKSGFVIAGIVSASLDEDARRKQKKGKAGKELQREHGKILVLDSSSSCTGVEKSMDCACSQSSAEARGPTNQKYINGTAGIKTSNIILEPEGKKLTEPGRGRKLVLYVICGSVEVTIHQTTIVCKKGDNFMIPAGNPYSIKNIDNRTRAQMFFAEVE